MAYAKDSNAAEVCCTLKQKLQTGPKKNREIIVLYDFFAQSK